MAIERQAAFSYAALAPDVRDRVETATRRLHDLERRTSESIIEMGQHLIEVKADLGHGNFLPWLESEFGWSDRTAERLIAVAKRFGDKSDTVSNLGAKVLYALASPSTPEDVRVEFTELAALGNTVTHKDVKNAIEQVRSRADNIPVVEWRGVDEDTGEILDDDEPEIEVEYVDPNDVSSYEWRPQPPAAPAPVPPQYDVKGMEEIAADIVRKYSRSVALRIADAIYEIAGD